MSEFSAIQGFPAPGLDGSGYGEGQAPGWSPAAGGWVPRTVPAKPADLSGAGYTTGQYVEWNGTTFAPATPAGGVELDATATDIQPLGTRAAGATGKASDAGHVHAVPALSSLLVPTAAVAMNGQKLTGLANGSAATDSATFGQIPTGFGIPKPADDGLLAWNYDPAPLINTSSAPAAETLYFLRLRLDEEHLVSNLWLYLSTVGATLTANESFAGIYKIVTTKMVLQTKTADQSSAWAATTGYKKMALEAGVTLAPGTYYVGILCGGATTFPKFGIPNSGGLAVNVAPEAPYRISHLGEKRTTLPTEFSYGAGVVAGSTGALNFWVALS